MVFPIHSSFILDLVFCLNQVSIYPYWLFVNVRLFDFDFLIFLFYQSDFFRKFFKFTHSPF